MLRIGNDFSLFILTHYKHQTLDNDVVNCSQKCVDDKCLPGTLSVNWFGLMKGVSSKRTTQFICRRCEM